MKCHQDATGHKGSIPTVSFKSSAPPSGVGIGTGLPTVTPPGAGIPQGIPGVSGGLPTVPSAPILQG